MHPAKIALFFGNFHAGGVQRVRLNLARGFTKRGLNVDLVVVRSEGELRNQIPPDLNVFDLGVQRASFALPALIRYLRSAQPAAVLSSQTHHNILAILARRLSGVSTRLIVGEHNNWQQVIKNVGFSTKILPIWARLFYPGADAIMAVSKGVADALSATTGIRREHIHVIYNPITLSEIQMRAGEESRHPWLIPDGIPVIMAAGRLNKQKDYPTLLKAFAILRSRRPVRLIIIGEGEERKTLLRLANKLDIDQDVDFPGFMENPYTFMANSDVFVLSSRWEGFPNALLEALACGTALVSTDCPSGPSEMLENGRYGLLVPVGDSEALAHAIDTALEKPIPSAFLKERAADFSLDLICQQYVELFSDN